MTRDDEIKEMVHLNSLLKIAGINATVFHWHFPITGIMVFRHHNQNPSSIDDVKPDETFTKFAVLKARVHEFLTNQMVSA